jgi:cellulose synthase/poly-beta-1,6-N-acetylglucosamine synthase-like glycosyltransferase
VLSIDADTILEGDALSRAVLPFLEDPSTVAVGGNVGIANGCQRRVRRVVDVAMPRRWLARFQVVEYMRSFLLFRLGVRVAECGGPDLGCVRAVPPRRRDCGRRLRPTAIGEDIDLTIRLQRHFRERRDPVRIAFDPNPLCWTQAPEDSKSLKSQRYRWRRGLLQVLWRHTTE